MSRALSTVTAGLALVVGLAALGWLASRVRARRHRAAAPGIGGMSEGRATVDGMTGRTTLAQGGSERSGIGLGRVPGHPGRVAVAHEDWLRTPLSELTFTVVDCETTGLDVDAGDALVAVGAVRVDGTYVRTDDLFDSLVDPGRPIPAETTAIHGIDDAMVVGAPSAPDVVQRFARFAHDSVIVGHQLAFDLGFLRPAAALGGVELEAQTLDTLLLSSVLDPDARHGLDRVVERYGVDIVGRHTALGDALGTAEVLAKMIPLLARQGIVTLDDAQRAGQASKMAEVLAERRRG